ncbi:MAG TPA: peptidoglycan DD-metalloendopeptidase family protein [Bacteroidetes bacterium]|nr:peptidoglycan DD-metalloendopeptidase family protein [Bacteroidota bacterium]
MKKTFTYGLLLLAVLWGARVEVCAQQASRTSLERQRQQLQADIKKLDQAIAANTKSQKARTVELQNLRSKVRIRERLVSTLNTDIGSLDAQINDKAQESRRLNRELDTLRASYATMCRNYAKNRSSGIRLMYILSSKSFLQAYRRGKYIQEYAEGIRRRGQQVREKEEQARAAVEELQRLRSEKASLLKEQTAEMATLKADQNKIQGLLSSLKKNKSQLERELKTKKQNAAQIQKQIEAIVAKELEAQRKKSGAKSVSEAGLTPQNQQLSSDFAQNKGRLPWPVERGTVYIPFGNQTYPGLNVQIVNPGISISVPQGSLARAVFAGTVTAVHKINGLYNVYINHGRYNTVYGDLESVTVKKGDRVETKQTVGKVYTDRFENKTIMMFCLFDWDKKQDPELWLAR